MTKDEYAHLLICQTEQQLSHLPNVLFSRRYDISPAVRPTLKPPWDRAGGPAGVTTFPLPLWASQSSSDPSGHRGISAWELDTGQIRSMMKSQQEEKLILAGSAHGETLTETR